MKGETVLHTEIIAEPVSASAGSVLCGVLTVLTFGTARLNTYQLVALENIKRRAKKLISDNALVEVRLQIFDQRRKAVPFFTPKCIRHFGECTGELQLS